MHGMLAYHSNGHYNSRKLLEFSEHNRRRGGLNSYVEKKVELNLRGIETAHAQGSRPISGICSIYYLGYADLLEHAPEDAFMGPRLHALNTKKVAEVVSETADIEEFHYLFDAEAFAIWCQDRPKDDLDLVEEMDANTWTSQQLPYRWEDILDNHLMPFAIGGSLHPSTVVNCPCCFQTRMLYEIFSVGERPDSPGLGLCRNCTTEALLADLLHLPDERMGSEFFCPDTKAMKKFFIDRIHDIAPERAARGLPNMPHLYM